MREMRKLVLSVLCILPLGMMAQALDTLRRYECDFEDQTLNLTWHFPKADGVTHHWCIDTAINNGGKYSMYVTADEGATPSYKNQGALVVAYTDIILRNSSDKYMLSFDWLAGGYTFLENDGLYVFWLPAVDPDLGDSIKVKSYPGNTIPTDWEPYALPLDLAKGKDYLRGKSTWNAFLSANSSQGDSRLTANGLHYRLVFAWRSGADGPVNPAACIDNIVIGDPRTCRAPKKMEIEKQGSDSLIVKWKRDTCCQNYEVGVYSYEDSLWIVNETKDTFFIYREVPEGFCDFYVRTKCLDTITKDYFYSAKIQASEFIYYPDNHCVDYITMTMDNCYTSAYHKGDPETQQYKTKYVTDDYHFGHEMVDNGSDEMSSRHTHHYSKMETDPRTGGRLKTVPAGELCSSRLGNWNNGGEAERAEFKFYVDAKKNPILILKYAVVLESPGHDKDKERTSTQLEDPRFTLNVLKNGQSIGQCASADFTSSWVKDGWHDTTVTIPPDPSRENPTKMNIVWKDWTTIGINLRQYDGETLTIQLTTFDCSLQAHFGYAYFVLGCASDDLNMRSRESCDGQPNTDFSAPSGFNYRWYQKFHPTFTLSTEQTFHIPETDTATYSVDVIFPEDPNCCFTLDATSQPRELTADWKWEYTPKDCKNYVTVTNNACVMNIKQWQAGQFVFRDTTRTDVSSYTWDWGGLPGENLAPGDTLLLPVDSIKNYGVTLYTTYNKCEMMLTDTIRVPELDTVSSVIDTLLIEGDSIWFGGRWWRETGVYRADTVNYQGCNKPRWLMLEMHENITATCAPEPICYHDNQWTVPYLFSGVRRGTRYSLLFDDTSIPGVSRLPLPEYGHDTIVMDIPAGLEPGYYPCTITFHDSLSSKDEKVVDWVGRDSLCVRYPASVINQRWNDVLSVKNADYNEGRWSFTDFQWYKNGEKIEGAVGTYIYQSLDTKSEYQVMLTRNGTAVMTCAYIPELMPGELDIPTLVRAGETIAVAGRGVASWYNCEGRLMQTQSYDESAISAPVATGLYLLQMKQVEGTTELTERVQTIRMVVQ